MKSFIHSGIVFFLMLVLLDGCLEDEITIEYLEEPVVEEEEVRDQPGDMDTLIYIVDQTGKKWEISHAVSQYGFEPGKFQFGLGPNAIPPMLEPKMIEPGQPGYPNKSSSFLILGTRLEEDARAYPLGVMSVHEIVDEDFDDLFVAVAY